MKMAFDFKKSLIKVQGGRTYLPVSARIVWFREEHPDWGIETEVVEINHEKQYAVFRARIYNAEGKLMATGTKKEDVKGFGDFIEKAETGSVGRALALCGFGTQFSPELDEVGGGRIVDSPYPVGGGNRFGGNGGGGGGRFDGGGSGNRFGNDGGSRFAPPREVSAPAREESPSRSAPPRDEAPRPAQAARPAPVVEDDDDEVDALMGVTEDDPFGEDEEAAPAPVRASGAPVRASAAPVRASAAPARPATASAAPGTPACINCAKALTRSQMELSVRNYGEALCPACQRERPRAERAPATVH